VYVAINSCGQKGVSYGELYYIPSAPGVNSGGGIFCCVFIAYAVPAFHPGEARYRPST